MLVKHGLVMSITSLFVKRSYEVVGHASQEVKDLMI